MGVLRGHFRPEFLNRIDEIIIFDALDKAQIEAIVRLQLDRVASTAQGQDIELVFDESLVKHLSSEGYQPEYGARELRRQIRNLLETKLAKAMLKGDIKEGNRGVCAYDPEKAEVTFELKQAALPAQPTKLAKGAGKKKKTKKTEDERKRHADELLDEALLESFPASDAPSVTRDRPYDQG